MLKVTHSFELENDLADLVTSARQDVLSVLLDVDPTAPEHRTPHPAYLIWLHQALQTLLKSLAQPARDRAERAARRVLAYMNVTQPTGRGLAIFTAPDLWRAYVLPFALSNRVEYGRAEVMPLLWAMSEYAPYAILAVYRDHARLIIAYAGRIAVVGDETLDLDTRDWRFKSGRTDTYTRRVGVGVGRGAQADEFDSRVEERLRRFWKGVAEATSHALITFHVNRIVLGGPEEVVAAVRELLPDRLQSRVIGTVPLPAYATLEEIRERTLPLAVADHERREKELVRAILEQSAANGHAVAGRAATLESLMEGEARLLVASRDLPGDAWECRHCHYVSARETDVCPACGGVPERGALRQTLPALAKKHGAALTVVGAEVAAQMPDGVGGLLRYRALAGDDADGAGMSCLTIIHR